LTKTAHTKIIVGGYPFKLNPDLCTNVGADGCAENAGKALILANGFFPG